MEFRGNFLDSRSSNIRGANVLAILTVSSRLKDGCELAGEVIQRLRKWLRGPNEGRLGLGGQFVWDFAYRARLVSSCQANTNNRYTTSIYGLTEQNSGQ